MNLSISCFFYCFVLLLAGRFDATALAAQATLADADRLYAEKSFAKALKVYEPLLNAGAVPEGRRDEVRYRVCVCLGRSEQWDRALAESVAFVRSRRGTVWEPRGLYWVGRLYLALPTYGMRLGDRTTFSRDTPEGRGDERATALDFTKEHLRNA